MISIKMDRMVNYLCLTVLAITLFGGFTFGITTDYLNTVCNVTSKALSTSIRLESSTSLYYSADTSCYYHVVADAGKLVLLLVRLFRLETEVSGSCVDYVNIHDGPDTSAATLNTSPLCGQAAADNYTSTGNQMTIYFHTDSTGQARGFEFLFVAITTGTCSANQLSCNTSICIDSSLQCNTVNECGDNVDENNCVYSTPKTDRKSYTGLIAGAIIGGLAFLVICIVAGVQLWKYIRWRFFLIKPIKAKKIEFEPTTYATTYPVTRLYYREQVHDMYEDPRKTVTSTTPVDSTSGTDHVTGIQNPSYDTMSH